MLSPEYQQTLGIDEQGRNLLYAYYKQRNFKPLWTSKEGLNEIGTTLHHLLQTPIQFGLSKKRFDLIDKDNVHPYLRQGVIVV